MAQHTSYVVFALLVEFEVNILYRKCFSRYFKTEKSLAGWCSPDAKPRCVTGIVMLPQSNSSLSFREYLGKQLQSEQPQTATARS